VTVPKDTIWALEPHTAAKHQILVCYLAAWFPILARYNGRVVYLDGFSGPGIYTGGEPGSPIVALRAAIDHRHPLKKDIDFFFIEERPDRADRLEAEIAKLALPANIHFNVQRGHFAETFGATLADIERRGLKMAPTFALIDPFGFSGLPYALIRKLLSHPKCEVLISFMVESINRWLTDPKEDIAAHIAETFGTQEAAALALQPNRVEALRDLYLAQLKKLARFVRYFEMRNRSNRVVYYLFFASNNEVGHARMKDAMWKVDPRGEFEFSDATNVAQTVMFENPHAEDLAEQIFSKFVTAGKVPVLRVKEFVNDETAYVGKHMTHALKILEENSRLTAGAKKSNGDRRHGKTFPDEVIITIHPAGSGAKPPPAKTSPARHSQKSLPLF
jgi:three-Cys-motif partner protein